MSGVVEIIEQALERKGVSASAASRLAVGNPSLIKNIRNGQGRVSFDHLQRLAAVLDLECRFGPVGDNAPLPAKLCARLHLPDGATEADALAVLDALPETAHQFIERRAALDAALAALDACRAQIEQARSGDPPAAAKAPP